MSSSSRALLGDRNVSQDLFGVVQRRFAWEVLDEDLVYYGFIWFMMVYGITVGYGITMVPYGLIWFYRDDHGIKLKY